jgi:threonine synthase
MNHVKGFTCIVCGEQHSLPYDAFTCKRCGGNLQVAYDYAYIRERFSRQDLGRSSDYSMWRYTPLMPFSHEPAKPPVLIGWTPLYRASRLGRKLGLKNLLIKDDGRNPSASTKDRASAVVIAKSLETDGAKIIACASTGNAASSLACLAAPMGIRAVIFVPETAPAAKVAQLLVFGASVIMVRGSYDEAFDLCLQASNEYGWYNRNTGYNPYTREGKKTIAYEICEQSGWQCPDWVFVPVGDGNIISGVWKGFSDLHEMGFIDRLPRLAGCQAEGSDAVTRAIDADGVISPVEGRTVADSIAVSMPRDGEAAVQALIHAEGPAFRVTDEEILDAIPEMARETGVFAEPASAVSLPALRGALQGGIIGEDETVVLLVTGNGLKDVDSAMLAVGKPRVINPDMDEVRRLLSDGFV